MLKTLCFFPVAYTYNWLVTNTHDNTDASGGVWMCVADLNYVKKRSMAPKKIRKAMFYFVSPSHRTYQQVVLYDSTFLMNIKHFEWIDNMQVLPLSGLQQQTRMCFSWMQHTCTHTCVPNELPPNAQVHAHMCTHSCPGVHTHIHIIVVVTEYRLE
jgi:hypothetical protein